MPHGSFWNRLNMIGQVVLAVALILAVLRTLSWIWPGSIWRPLFDGALNGWHPLGVQTNYYWIVDVGFAGILGVGLYFHFSGRVWCRFACPLAALMHVYARFTQFRILADKKKCISCSVCTSVCHQGIDIMAFANKGLPMEDPQCVRCSACVESCPTGVLSFGRVDRAGSLISVDKLVASPVQQAEK
jgi:polyferredoxin